MSGHCYGLCRIVCAREHEIRSQGCEGLTKADSASVHRLEEKESKSRHGYGGYLTYKPQRHVFARDCTEQGQKDRF